jgi:acylpyruvate hydrolase
MDHPGFDTFCPVSDFLPADSVEDPHNLNLWIKVAGKIKQQGNTSDMM